jgi:exodeoxyribonuclease-3
MRISTWNVNSLAVRLPQVLDWLTLHRPDVLCLQETKLSDDKFPAGPIREAGYQVEWFGQKTYNGVALLSKQPATDVVRNIPGHDDHQARVIAGTVEGVRIVCAYVPNGQSVESDKFPYKLAWLDALRDWIAKEQAQHPQLALLGDYNIAPEDRDVHDPVAWAGQVLCTPQERAHFKALLASGLYDSFRLFEQAPKLYSWWDYRMLAFRKNQGLRIDHILVSEALKDRVTGCVIDKLTRKNERPSDHAPVICELS